MTQHNADNSLARKKYKEYWTKQLKVLKKVKATLSS